MPTVPRSAPRSTLLVLALALTLTLAGCLTAPAADVPDANAGASALSLTCADPCGVPLTDRDGRAFEPHAAGNPNDPHHRVVASFFSAPGLVTFVTRDDGRSWTMGGIPAGADAPEGHPFRDASHLGDPVLTVLEDGTVLLAGLVGHFEYSPAGNVGEGSDIFVARSTDGGITFPDVTIVAEGDGRAVHPASPVPGASASATAGWVNHDKEWITVGPDGTLLLVWIAIEPETPVVGVRDYRNTLHWSASEDGGVTWTDPAPVPTEGGVGAPFPVITHEGTWLVAFHDWAGGLHVAASRDAGASWTVDRVGDAERGQPVLRALPGRVLLASPSRGPLDGVQVPALRESTDDGASWSRQLVLATPDAPGQAHPAMDVTPERTVVVGWYHHTTEDRVDYRVVAVRNGTVGPALTLAEGMDGPASAFGHYVTGVIAHEEGASVTWVQPTDSGRTLATANVTFTP